MAPRIRVLFAGETDAAGPARYLLGVLRWMDAQARHVPCTRRITPAHVRGADAIIFSDYPRDHASVAAQRAVAQRVAAGAGLLMVGGWSSFAAPCGGGWQGSVIDGLLPVQCLASDDRVNVPSGAVVEFVSAHPSVRASWCAAAPAICGYNALRVRRGATVVLAARHLAADTSRAGHPVIGPSRRVAPLLVVGQNPVRRTAALTTDVAPHWCGGLVDWGRRRVTVDVARGVRIEVGDLYLTFLASLIRWLAGRGR